MSREHPHGAITEYYLDEAPNFPDGKFSAKYQRPNQSRLVSEYLALRQIVTDIGSRVKKYSTRPRSPVEKFKSKMFDLFNKRVKDIGDYARYRFWLRDGIMYWYMGQDDEEMTRR